VSLAVERTERNVGADIVRVLFRRRGGRAVSIAEAANVGPATPYILHRQVCDSRLVRELARRDRARVLRPLWDQLIDAGVARAGSLVWMAQLPLAEAVRLGEYVEGVPRDSCSSSADEIDPRLRLFVAALADLLVADMGYLR